MANKLTKFLSRILNAPVHVIARVGDFAAAQIVTEARKSEFTAITEPRRLTIAEQWRRLADVISGSTSQAQEATRCHAAAALQLDLAQYALTTLVEELSAVMDMQGRRKQATVHVLEVAPTRALGDAIAA
jgi:hypothetical protein